MKIIMVPSVSPVRYDISPRASSKTTSGFLKFRSSCRNTDLRFSLATSFGPYCFSLLAASSAFRPPSPECSVCRTTAASDCALSRSSPETFVLLPDGASVCGLKIENNLNKRPPAVFFNYHVYSLLMNTLLFQLYFLIISSGLRPAAFILQVMEYPEHEIVLLFKVQQDRFDLFFGFHIYFKIGFCTGLRVAALKV